MGFLKRLFEPVDLKSVSVKLSITVQAPSGAGFPYPPATPPGRQAARPRVRTSPQVPGQPEFVPLVPDQTGQVCTVFVLSGELAVPICRLIVPRGKQIPKGREFRHQRCKPGIGSATSRRITHAIRSHRTFQCGIPELPGISLCRTEPPIGKAGQVPMPPAQKHTSRETGVPASCAHCHSTDLFEMPSTWRSLAASFKAFQLDKGILPVINIKPASATWIRL